MSQWPSTMKEITARDINVHHRQNNYTSEKVETGGILNANLVSVKIKVRQMLNTSIFK